MPLCAARLGSWRLSAQGFAVGAVDGSQTLDEIEIREV
jgi:hypothetical protein